VVFVVPGDLDTRTGGYAYDRHIIEGLRDAGWTVEVLALADGFPWPDAAALADAAERIAGLPDGCLVVVDGLAFGALPELDPDGIVADIRLLTAMLRTVLAELNFRNLDEEAVFHGRNTTTEFLARAVFDRVAARIDAGELGQHAGGLCAMKVTLHESHVAWAAYEGELPAAPRP